MSAYGWGIAFSSATGNAIQDVFRKKILAKGFESLEAVSMLSIFGSIVAFTWSVLGSQVPDVVTSGMWYGSACTAAGKILASYFYIKAVKIAPLSQTVPFLALNPVILLFVGMIWLDEQPGFWGITGTCLVLLGAYILSLGMKAMTKEVRSKKELDIEESTAEDSTTNDDSDKTKTANKVDTGSWESYVPPAVMKAFHENEAMWYMCFVCIVWTYTAAFEKWTLHNTPITPVFFVGMQRVFQTIPSFGASLYARTEFIDIMFTSIPMLLVAAAVETTTAVLYYVALDYIFVSYVIAIKRGYGMFLSVMIGFFYYKEKLTFLSRCAVLVMIFGMLMIVLTS